ncbi:DUF262 domain-containing HNH endonuclease family protein [Oceanihabitans sp. 2_MG-2023]|uniref:DUF262 domain-containing protein n=1 Tax=Oceanihabitans sp. 2_MG-2023 TaxID=3062661 RepID=UPI0026E48855|nr:DUF262 domain-containing HNH endonuclease family protein [Oceanihabitans sp. 2_MG-2023]MDO6597247.1 DUF262 domain-containing HNH endonuclease family protein [Oceanihabitans sp. 2_MG-2023]
MANNLVELNIEEVFSNNTYAIPIYQRNYAWKEAQIKQLIQDVYDYAKYDKTTTQKYYIGSLVVFERKTEDGIVYETIDGQQRLTTLNILFSILKNEFDIHINNYKTNLHFDSRPMSSYTLEHLYNKTKKEDVNKSEKKLNVRITDAYTIAKKELNKIKKANHLEQFVNYLKANVIILRVPVPKDTDLNHYFEIMNNRGEQLEKHEVLKAKMLKVFSKEKKESHVFNTIWEASANMEKYVQHGFNTEVRSALFGKDWNHFEAEVFEDVITSFSTKIKVDNTALTIEALLKDKQQIEINKEEEDDAPERFNSVINFSNFLLHILRILVNSNPNYELLSEDKKNIPLDDKRLMETFDFFLNVEDKNKKKAFVKDFAFLLLKGKHYYDKYIIKRNLKDDKWSLKYLKVEYYNKKASHQYINSLGTNNKSILMLLSMFHVSAPTLIYKHWLNAALNYVLDDGKDRIDGEDYICYLEDLSDAYLYDRFLAKQENDYFNIIYINDAYSTANMDDLDKTKLNQGTSVENFIFNRLDYLLWKQDQEKENKQFSDFSFSFRTSVEHYYPQNPMEGQERLDTSALDSFGNLCLISRNKNSKLSNYMPTAKKEHYAKRGSIESIKQQIMMQEKHWQEIEIEQHAEKMTKILLTTRK